MQLLRAIISLAALVLCQSCAAKAGPVDSGVVEAASSDEGREYDLVIDQVLQAIQSSNFAALNEMERSFRTSRAKTPSGRWKLAAFHAAAQYHLGNGLDPGDGCVMQDASKLRKWREADLDAPGPVITEAALLSTQAWCIRGGGYASEVPAAAWPRFRAKTRAAFDLLEANRQKASVDPEFYAVMAKLYRSQGKSVSDLNDLIEEATRREPYYHRTYFSAAPSYLPQWGGSYGQLDDFARLAAEKTEASDKTGFYARVYWSLDECGCDTIRNAADWDDMKQAMRDVYQRYPVKHNAQYFEKVTCKMDDLDEAMYYIRALTPDALSDADRVLFVKSCEGLAGAVS